MSGEAKRRAVLTRLEFERQDPHADQVAAVDGFGALGDHGTNSQQFRPLGRPVARRPGAVFFAGENDEWYARFAIFHRSVVDTHLLPARLISGPAALRARSKLVLESNICEGAA